MAITERYIDVSGSTTWSDSLSTSTPVTLATALANAAAGDRLNVKAGTYTLSANTTFATSGTTTSPIIFRGVSATWTVIPVTRTSGNGDINSTLPVFALAAGFYWAGTGSYVIYDSIKITGALTNASGLVDLHTGGNRLLHGCVVDNSHTANTVIGLSLGDNDTVVNSDAYLTGTGYTTSCYAINCNGNSGRILYSRVSVAGTGSGIRLGTGGSVIGCCIHDVGQTGIFVAQTASGNTAIYENTLVNILGAAISITTGTTKPVFIFNNRITDCGTYGYFCADATNIHFDGYNRYDRNTTANTSGGADWTTATTWANNTTAAIIANEYSAAASKNYNLVAGAQGIGSGIFTSRDMGGLQTAGTGDTIIGGGGGGGSGSGYKGVVKKGTTSYICHVQVSDSSNGDPKTGLAYSAFAASYMRSGASAITTSTVVTITTLGTFAGTATDTAVKEVSSVSAPGLYEVHVPNNAIATGTNRVTLMLRDAATNGFQPVLVELHLVDYDPQDAVRAGLTAMPNAAAGSASGLPITSDLSDDTTVADALLDRVDAIETGLSPRNALKLIGAATAGTATVSGAGPWIYTYKSALTASKNRIVMTAASDGTRSSPTYDVT